LTLGLQYHADEKWTWRAGLAFDQTPVPDAEHRTARIPDEDRISVAIGAQYRLSKQTKLDFGYMHIFFDDAAIDHCEPETACPAGVTLTGSFDVSADIFGAQFTYNF
jgi:long-chain fatty acid transport protein